MFTVEDGMVGEVLIGVGKKTLIVPSEHIIQFIACFVRQQIGRELTNMSDRAVLGLEELEEGDPR